MEKSIIIFPLLAWGSGLLHRDQALAKEFAKQGVETYYLDRITRAPWHIFAGGKSKMIEGVNVVSVFVFPYFRGYLPFIYRVNNLLILWQLRVFRTKVDSSTLYVSNPDWAPLVGKLCKNGNSVIYDISDDYVLLAKNDKWREVVAQHEKKMIESADKFVVTTPLLTDKINLGKPHLIVPNGVDLTGFDRAKPIIPRGDFKKVAGFIGGIYEWVNLGLVRMLAEKFPEVLFVLIGPTNRNKEITALGKINNVHYLGVVPKEQIANYFAGIDIGLLPFVSEQEYPRLKTVDSGKVYQYLYFGYPIISTDYEQAKAFGEYISVAGDENTFLEMFRDALDAKKSRNNQKFATENSWAKRAKTIIEFIK